MTPGGRIAGRAFDALWWSAIGLWFAAVAAVGIAASSVFPILRDLQPTLEGYPVDPALHWRYAAGMVMERVFLVADTTQLVVAPVALLVAVGSLVVVRGARRRPLAWTRALAVVVATAAFAWYAFGLAPRMHDTLHAQWDAARAGDETAAEAARAAFDGDHRTADAIYRVVLAGVVVAGIAAALDARSAPTSGPGTAARHPHPDRSESSP